MALPHRRVSGSRAQAFALNPYATLGPDAKDVIDEEQFEQAREEAGLRYERFIPHIERDAVGYPNKVSLLIESASAIGSSSSEVTELNDDELADFVGRLQVALAKNFQLLGWRGYDLELLGESSDYLAELQEALLQRRQGRSLVPSDLIDAVIDSGYYIRDWVDPFSGKTWESVSDMMYGNKQFSSSFRTEKFIQYIRGNYSFPALPPLNTYEAKCVEEIQEILSDSRRAHYASEGTLTLRGQPREYTYMRKIPNPVRANANGEEVSMLPGIYRQKDTPYSLALAFPEQRSFQRLLAELEPNNPDVYLDSAYTYDIMRTEQHYATQTSGLDLAFDLDTALFFATHHFKFDAAGLAYYDSVPHGEHTGVIYCFRFCDPPVKRSQYLIRNFDLFKTHSPVRIIRQDCGLPLIGPHERNIALTDIDCVIRLAPEFKLPIDFRKVPEYMFPSTEEDGFYKKLLALKDKYPSLLGEVVEYKWARNR